ncbi:hypothetical protein LX32DRAFT_4467 [Colletotrichum zoysiae]|uniref:Uncharacterized protein n=1 Tax=Colletotrichum zoysiae TaxID=1216348 RepID=A0AAD9M9S4_9PEZI|nr:hypothetical protein LX32DRAFT_4467 [Colletotrichum zoysiae]
MGGGPIAGLRARLMMRLRGHGREGGCCYYYYYSRQCRGVVGVGLKRLMIVEEEEEECVLVGGGVLLSVASARVVLAFGLALALAWPNRVGARPGRRGPGRNGSIDGWLPSWVDQSQLRNPAGRNTASSEAEEDDVRGIVSRVLLVRVSRARPWTGETCSSRMYEVVCVYAGK